MCRITLLAHELQKVGLAIPDGILTREELIDALQKWQTRENKVNYVIYIR